MIDRDIRQKLAGIIEKYLDERISAFAFDEQLQEIETEDQSVQEAIEYLWMFYDDLKDHKVLATKEDWNFFQRLLVFLSSDLEISDFYRREKRRKWSFTQGVAGIALLTQLYFLFQGLHWFVIISLGAVVSLTLWVIQRHSSNRLFSRDEHAKSRRWQVKFYPFSSVTQMRRIVCKTGCQKRAYPDHLKHRTIRDETENTTMKIAGLLSFFGLNVFFSPIILLFECFPLTDYILKTQPNKDINSASLGFCS